MLSACVASVSFRKAFTGRGLAEGTLQPAESGQKQPVIHTAWGGDLEAVGWVTLRGHRKWHQQQCLQPQRQAREAERPGHEKFIRPLRDGGGSSRRGEEGALICPGGRADAPCALALQ
ncbi:hypothetical protein SRHO_G00156650 [Serrasalmus rhombeus]